MPTGATLYCFFTKPPRKDIPYVFWLKLSIAQACEYPCGISLCIRAFRKRFFVANICTYNDPAL